MPGPDGNHRYQFCPKCGAPFERAVRYGRERLVCPACRFIFFQNPIVGVAAIVIEDGQVLLTRRAAGIGAGLWDLPGGYVEYDEDLRDAALRELREETGLTVALGDVYDARSNFHDPDGHTVGVWLLARRVSGTLRAADDAIEARFFPFASLPAAAEIAFPTDRAVLARLQAEHGITATLDD